MASPPSPDTQAAAIPAQPCTIPSVLARAGRSAIRYDPFVHLVIEDCLPSEIYRALEAAFPDDATVVGLNKHSGRQVRSNQRNDILAHRALEDPSPLAPIWQDFIRHHTSQAFYSELIALLGPELRTTHPHLESRLRRPLEACRAGVRFDPESDRGEISMDCQVGINTPTTTPSSVIGVHVDDPTEIVAMMLYLRHPEDTSSGGDLELHRWRHPQDRRFRSRNGVNPEDAEPVTSVPYGANTLVVFINSLDSLHSVSERSIARHSRRLVNLIVEVNRSVPEGLFPVVLKEEPTAAPLQLRQRLRRKLTAPFRSRPRRR